MKSASIPIVCEIVEGQSARPDPAFVETFLTRNKALCRDRFKRAINCSKAARWTGERRIDRKRTARVDTRATEQRSKLKSAKWIEGQGV